MPFGRNGEGRRFASGLAPEIAEPVRRKLRIAYCVLNVPMAEIGLERARVVTVICELVPASVAQHMWVNAPELGRLPSSRNHLGEARRSERCAATQT